MKSEIFLFSQKTLDDNMKAFKAMDKIYLPKYVKSKGSWELYTHRILQSLNSESVIENLNSLLPDIKEVVRGSELETL